MESWVGKQHLVFCIGPNSTYYFFIVPVFSNIYLPIVKSTKLQGALGYPSMAPIIVHKHASHDTL